MDRCIGVGEIENLNSIGRQKHWSQSSAFYRATCDEGYHLKHGYQNYECKERLWFPEIKWEPADFTTHIWSTSASFVQGKFSVHKSCMNLLSLLPTHRPNWMLKRLLPLISNHMEQQPLIIILAQTNLLIKSVVK